MEPGEENVKAKRSEISLVYLRADTSAPTEGRIILLICIIVSYAVNTTL